MKRPQKVLPFLVGRPPRPLATTEAILEEHDPVKQMRQVKGLGEIFLYPETPYHPVCRLPIDRRGDDHIGILSASLPQPLQYGNAVEFWHL